MKLNQKIGLLFITAFISLNASAQQKKLTWEELRKDYNFPKWFAEARFGIWVHWGAQTQPAEGGGWYARHMYMQNVGNETWGAGAYPYHVKTYGHPSEKGFKDVIHEWKADKLNTDELLKYFKNIGAKYFVALANHHDHFDNFASTYQPWNSVNVGPKKDLIGLFQKSAQKYGIPFGVSSHDDRYLEWWKSAFGADSTGPKKGVKYDGWLTKADGKGKWWEGLDPADLYGLPPEKRTPEWVKSVKENYVKRHEELISRYNPDMLWFDGYGFPYGNYGKEVCSYFYNQSLHKDGKVSVLVAGKMANEPSVAKDFERGGSSTILPQPWQGTLTFGSWFYKSDKPLRHNAKTVIETLTDYMSKNGNLLLNVELLPDGTIPPKHKLILDTIGRWVNTNAEAIYGSKPWKVYGDNLHGVRQKKNISEADLEANKKQENEDFNERTISSKPYPHNEVRFTTKDKNLYVFVLNPVKGKIEIPALGWQSVDNNKKISSINLVGDAEKIDFEQTKDKLVIAIDVNNKFNYTKVYKVVGVL
ncbi:alpha-L-fucosidase [Pedobacter frigoris]|uniref:alpha-L-fucosidase n=1 Tax=Pedobacter frigoris TaxID=2571272 RepID=UPI002930B8F6|nr:alpha-L-fucosidase [Pedobacter frigoris]